MGTPNVASIFSSGWLVSTFFMMLNMTVLRTAATTVKNAAKKLMSPSAKPSQQLRERGAKFGERRRARGDRRSERNAKMAPRRKKENIMFEATLIRVMMVRTSAGREMVAPARSSESRILTGSKK